MEYDPKKAALLNMFRGEPAIDGLTDTLGARHEAKGRVEVVSPGEVGAVVGHAKAFAAPEVIRPSREKVDGFGATEGPVSVTTTGVGAGPGGV